MKNLRKKCDPFLDLIKLYLCVEFGAADIKHFEYIRQQAAYIESDNTVDEELVAELDDYFVTILQGALWSLYLILVATQQHTNKGVRNWFTGSTRCNHTTKADNSSQNH